METVLYDLLNAFGVSGSEKKVIEVIKEKADMWKCETFVDKMNNFIVKCGQGNEKVMICAHMDQIGFIVSYIEDNGIIRVHKIGDFSEEEVLNSFVVHEKGTAGMLKGKQDDLYVEIGAESRNDVISSGITEGSTFAIKQNAMELPNGKIMAANLDNRIGCYALLKIIENIGELDKEVYFVFSTQNEIGGRGARAAAYSIKPDYCFVLDTIETSGTAGSTSKVEMGKGPVAKVLDRSLIMHHDVKEKIEKAADSLNMKVQYSIAAGTSEGGLIHKEIEGIKTGEISIPCKYRHSNCEIVSLKDVEEIITLIKEMIK